jgi:hypothetical protein
MIAALVDTCSALHFDGKFFGKLKKMTVAAVRNSPRDKKMTACLHQTSKGFRFCNSSWGFFPRSFSRPVLFFPLQMLGPTSCIPMVEAYPVLARHGRIRLRILVLD